MAREQQQSGAVDGRLAEAMGVLRAALEDAAARDPRVVDALEVLVRSLRSSPTEPGPAPAEPTEPAEVPEAARAEEPAPGPQAPPEPQAAPAPDWHARRVDLDLIARRAGLKAEALEWAVRRRELDVPGVDFDAQIKPHDARLMARSDELESCRLWMLMPHGAGSSCKEWELKELEHAYRAVECAARTTLERDLEELARAADDSLARFLELVAEAQSGLLAALAAAGAGRDEDQYELWCWLRQTSEERDVFLERYMSRSRPASPEGLRDLPERMAELLEELESRSRRHKERRNRVGRIEYHVKKIGEAVGRDGDPDAPGLAHDWARISETLEEHVAGGGQVTDRVLLSALAPVVEDFPEELVRGHVGRVMEAAERWLDARSEERIEERQGADRPEPEDGPASVREALERVTARHPDRLAVALNNRSDGDYDYARPAEVEEALEWLATERWEAHAGQGGGRDHQTLNRSLLERCGWFYRPHQSATTMGRFPDWYRCQYEGRTLTLEEHVGRGNTKRQGRNSVRIAFAWDPPSRRIVIGFLGQHQRTTQT